MATETPATVVAQEPTTDALLNEKAAPLSHDTPVDVSAAGSTKEPASPPTEKLAETVPPNVSEFIEPVPGETVKTPFTAPYPTSKPAPPAPLTAEQQKKYDDLLAVVATWDSIPVSSAKDAASEPITDAERMWLTRECLLRYLRATKWNPVQAPKRLLATLTWRREYGVYKFTADYCSPENETGKQVLLGYDIEARPCFYMFPSKQNTQKSDRQLHNMVFMLEKAIEMMIPGQETLALVINYKDSTAAGGPSVGQGKETLDILQGHYPERLGRALNNDLPWYVTMFLKVISPFIDPVTKSKLRFNEALVQHIPPAQLMKQYGGEADFVYDHSVYWPALDAMCKARVKRQVERWEKAGKQVGELEGYLRGGEVKSLNGELLGSEV